MSTAAAPATCGDAMLVPLHVAHCEPGSEDTTSTPGAVTSGFICRDTGVGPLEEKLAISSGGPVSLSVDAATVIASGALPGEPTVPRPPSSNSLPAAMTGTTPAAAASSIALTTTSRCSWISGSPSERLMTFIPSRTAASMPAAISGALPSSPKFSVGMVSTL